MELETKSKVTIRMQKIARKKVFAELVASKECQGGGEGTHFWRCCSEVFNEPIIIYKHISREHCDEIEKRTKSKLELSESDGAAVEDVKVQTKSDGTRLCQRTSDESKAESDGTTTSYSADAVFPWLPAVPHQNVVDSVDAKQQHHERGGQVLLFYHYVKVEDPHDICRWQKELCTRLSLHGKIRIAEEGLNGTVGGSIFGTQLYMKAVIAHPTFSSMEAGDFKTSHGGKESFPDGLVVSVHQEIVPMGKDPREITPQSAGKHLSPEDFHDELKEIRTKKEGGQAPDTILIDCRNFYESKIGAFTDAITPDIRKFSYWPEYVDKNRALFADKRVLMYCTGGIRCERGSAYLKMKGVCKEVLQLKGGIHRYIEQYPDGFFRGKLFVFDDRYSIHTNQDIISNCFHCGSAWDQYQPCTSEHCHQLVLSCPACREGGRTTCCRRCGELAEEYAAGEHKSSKKRREECSCTRNRERIPLEKLGEEREREQGNQKDAS